MNPYEELGTELGKLTGEKNAAYGDSARFSAEILAIFYPKGIPSESYCDVMLMTRIIDKLFRIANKKGAFGECPYRDIAGYGIVGAVNDENARRRNRFEEVPKENRMRN